MDSTNLPVDLSPCSELLYAESMSVVDVDPGQLGRALRGLAPQSTLRLHGEQAGGFTLSTPVHLVGDATLVGTWWGPVLCVRASVTLEGLTLQGGRGLNGGALSLLDGELRGSGLRVTGGFAMAGGGIFVGPGTQAWLEGCSVVSNRARCGGGIAVEGGQLHLSECTVSDNRAWITGSGIALRGAAMVKLLDCYPVDNLGPGQVEAEDLESRVEVV